MAAPSHSPSAEAEYWRIKAMAQQVSVTSRGFAVASTSNRESRQEKKSPIILEFEMSDPEVEVVHKLVFYHLILTEIHRGK